MPDFTNRRPAHPWLVWFVAGLAMIYAVLWPIELYLYLIALAAGTVGFPVCLATLVIARFARRRRPLLGPIEIGAATFGILAHLTAWAVLRTVSWG